MKESKIELLQDSIQSGEIWEDRKIRQGRALEALSEGRCFFPPYPVSLPDGRRFASCYEAEATERRMGSLELTADY